MINNVRRAYCYALVQGEVFVEIPEEDKTLEDERDDNIAQLDMTMYGTREAAAAWQTTVAKHLAELGFQRGRTNGCVYRHQRTLTYLLVLLLPLLVLPLWASPSSVPQKGCVSLLASLVSVKCLEVRGLEFLSWGL